VADSRANHPQHDLELVAAYAAGEASASDLERAERLLDACDLCVGVARELRAITFALQELPAASSMTNLPVAPRDFRLTPEQAASLRPTTMRGPIAPVVRWSDRLLGAIGAFGRPVGASLATLGIVGLLVGAGSLGGFGAAGSATSAPAAPQAALAAPTMAGAPADDGGAAGNVPAATTSAGEGTGFGAESSGGIRSVGGGRTGATSAAGSTSAPASTAKAAASANPSSVSAGPNLAGWLFLTSAAALVGGIGLIVIATRRG
jgi:hypothetical protein